MSNKGMSEHGYPLVMACDHVLYQESKPVQCDYSPPDYICENCHDKITKAEDDPKKEAEAVKLIKLYCSDCIKKNMFQ